MRLADRHLINECLNGDPSAFGMLVERYKEGVYALAYSKLHNFHDAEDVTQEAFIKAYQNLRELRKRDEFHAWIYAIANNLCKDWIKAKSRQPDSEFIEDHAESLNKYQYLQDDPTIEQLNEALELLPEIYQQVLTLHYLGGMDGREMAEFLGVSPNSIWQRLSRARSLLRKELLDMMSDTFEHNRLRVGFTFRIVEIIKGIKINPMPPKTLPWGLSIATGIVIAILGIGTQINITDGESYTSASSIGEVSVLNFGEFPIDVMKASDISAMANANSNGDGVGNTEPSLQNALFMAPQAEGGTWTKKADMPNARHFHSSGVVDGKIYLIGGCFPFGWALSVEEYDPVTDKWTKKTDMPTASAGLSVGVVDGKIYAIGGVNNLGANGAEINLSIVEEYDPATNKWTKKTDMPTARCGLSVSTIDGKIYAIGGANADNWGLSTVEEYDPLVDKWTKKADMPTGRRYLSTSVVNGKIYAIGGSDKDGVLPTVEEYDPSLDRWTRKSDMLTGRTDLSTSVLDEKIYAIGGIFRDFDGRTEEYNPVTDKWIRKSDMPTARYRLSTSAVNGKIYAIGGYDLNNIIATVEEYDTEFSSKSIDFKGKLPTTWGEMRMAMNR
jgi:RNA polymerase sigma factor (sigma-70 family)